MDTQKPHLETEALRSLLDGIVSLEVSHKSL